MNIELLLIMSHVCSNAGCNKTHSSTRRSVCKGCYDTANPPTDIMEEDDENIPELPEDWMNKPISELLGGHLTQLIKNNIKPIKDILEEQATKIKALEKDNEKLKTDGDKMKGQLKVSEGKVKNLEKDNILMKDILNKQHSYIARQDKLVRSKNLIISGLSEKDALEFHGNVAETDQQKVELILQAMNKDETEFVHCRRVGNEDQGHEGRGRFLLIEFLNQAERNAVRKAGEILSSLDELKHLRLKADLTKEERDEYKRLYAAKDAMVEAHPEERATIRIDKGKLMVGEREVDRIKHSTKLF